MQTAERFGVPSGTGIPGQVSRLHEKGALPRKHTTGESSRGREHPRPRPPPKLIVISRRLQYGNEYGWLQPFLTMQPNHHNILISLDFLNVRARRLAPLHRSQVPVISSPAGCVLNLTDGPCICSRHLPRSVAPCDNGSRRDLPGPGPGLVDDRGQSGCVGSQRLRNDFKGLGNVPHQPEARFNLPGRHHADHPLGGLNRSGSTRRLALMHPVLGPGLVPVWSRFLRKTGRIGPI